jgi:hypothetical protein
VAGMKTRLARLEAVAAAEAAAEPEYPFHFVEHVRHDRAGGLAPGLYWRGVPGSRAALFVYDPAVPWKYPPGIVDPYANGVEGDGPLPEWRLKDLVPIQRTLTPPARAR